MDAADIKAKIEAIMRESPVSPKKRTPFVANAVTFTVGRLPAHRHVSAFELLGGVRDYAREEFGVLAYEVLYEWGIRSASDVGRIVYLLIGSGLLSASKDDAPEDSTLNSSWPILPADAAAPAAKLPKID